jgi:hypothetical protein
MPDTYRLHEWRAAAETVYFQAVKARNIPPGRLANIGGVGGAECKLKSQVGELADQLALTDSRIEAMGVRFGQTVYVPDSIGRPQDRLLTARDIGAPMTWVAAAPRDARTEAGWARLHRILRQALHRDQPRVRP